MTVKELNREQLIELKERYYMDKHRNVSYSELASIDQIVSDDKIFKAYASIDFVNDDFFCSKEY